MYKHRLTLSTFFLLLFSYSFAQDKKPQEPVAPFPYLSEDVVFLNEIDTVMLAGTLTMPEKGSDFPVVVLISGSGPQDRNSELLGHKPFLVMSDYLTRNGIAVLRVDDRGTAASQGVYNETGVDGFIRDAEYAVAYLKTRNEINQSQIGLIGHSLGGMIAPMIASTSQDIDFIIMLAGPGMRGDKLMLLQKEKMERGMGINDEGIAAGQKNIGGAYEIIINSEPQNDSLAVALKAYFAKAFEGALPEQQLQMISDQLTIPWLLDLIRHDPAETFKNVKCPVLALNGENDLQVPSKENLMAIEKGVKANGNKEITVMELPGLNHLFQESESGMPTEYGTIEQTFSEEVLKIMSDWILETTSTLEKGE